MTQPLTPLSTRPAPLVDPRPFATGTPAARQSATAHRVYEALIAMWSTGVIEAGHDLGLFERLATGPATVPELAADLGADPRATRVLCDALVVYGVLERGDHGRFAMPADIAACLLADGLYSLAGKIFYDRTVAWDAWRGLADAVRRGPVDAHGDDQANQISDVDYEQLTGGINFWAPPIAELLAGWLRDAGWDARPGRTVLDVGCGTGIYSHLLLQAFPGATSTGLEAARIVPIADRQAGLLGVADRFTATACDFMSDPWPSGVDLALFVNIFHLQHPAAARRLLARSAAALAPDGVLCVVDHIVDREGPLDSPQDRFALLFAASMLATGGGGAHALADYDLWLAGAGLRRVALLDAPMHRVLFAARADAALPFRMDGAGR
ncbi:class I SAM-dependent methyltransferase [Actinomadura rayongensis]|uniref:Methyltransferase domain-containing protein n=1 Tax=Actinomadura rayongensis TaxID=1429076 RepID=A0A6I4VXR1_9ACTN|nr:class I SAM-dependent methyltransferase [Actinomadura rayongensis]MXQ63169.1 methyltransferase domain-containing protein [Actinomadura rayongensis]